MKVVAERVNEDIYKILSKRSKTRANFVSNSGDSISFVPVRVIRVIIRDSFLWNVTEFREKKKILEERYIITMVEEARMVLTHRYVCKLALNL